MFVDSHAHLDSPDFEIDLKDVLRRSKDAGIESVLSVGCTQSDILSLSKFTELLTHDQIYGAAGVHPHDAHCYSETLGEQMAALMQHPKILGWGEIGLDFYYDNSPRPQQIDVFRKQLRLARTLGQPVIIHSRKATDMTCRILEEEFSDGPGGIIHCFVEQLSIAQRCIPLGFYISFGGILTFKSSVDLRNTASQIRRDRVLIETDAPYLAPVPFRGKRNEPSFVLKVAETLADVWGVSSQEVGALTTDNFKRLFGTC